MKTKAFISLVCMAALLSSCSTKTSAIRNLSAFQRDIERDGINYTIRDWENAKEDYEKINKRILKYKDQYTPEEYEKIGVLQGKCLASFAKGVTGNIMNKAVNAASAVKGILQGLGTEKEK